MSSTTLPPLPDLARPCRGRVFKYGDDVNTDVLFPGKYTYTHSLPEDVVQHALEDLDPGFRERVRTGDVIVAGRNFGCGSSREQAATAIRYSGVAAVVALSFGRIFYRNAINSGLPAIACAEAVAALEAGNEVELDLAAGILRRLAPEPETRFELPPMSTTVKQLLAAGGLIPFTAARLGHTTTT